jgi:hypothetical protein
VARRDRPASDGELRQHLLRLEMAQLCTLLGVDWSPALSGKGALFDQLNAPDHALLPQLTPEQLESPFASSARALAAGEPHGRRRGELPDWHPVHFTGDLNDEFELVANDVFRPASVAGE